MLLDYHMHLENGDFSKEWALSFWETASSRGISEIGFSEHVYRFRQAIDIVDNDWARVRCTEDLDAYVSLIQKLQAEGYPIKLGLEIDYFPEKEETIRKLVDSYPFDYVLGSIHWLGSWGFDNPEWADEWERRDLDQVYREYFDLLKQAASSGLFNSLSHPDVIKVFGHRPEGDLRALYQEVVQVIARNPGLCIEVSTAGLRKPVGRLYPEPEFLELAYKHRIPVTMASDAHYPQDAGADYPQAVEFLRQAGYQQITRFTAGKSVQVELG
ncbi:MAG: histidinol-phosphatase HisJ family protein [Firmicutes bacterium]|nr:histidinol-phosphatase HisJ family protein [Bacillota bacterium]